MNFDGLGSITTRTKSLTIDFDPKSTHGQVYLVIDIVRIELFGLAQLEIVSFYAKPSLGLTVNNNKNH